MSMSRCKEMFSILTLVAPLAVCAVLASPLVPVSEAATTGKNANLCEVTTGVCTHCPIEAAPVLKSDVCWNGEVVKLKGTGCASGYREYYLSYGSVVDPLTNEILAYSPVPDACTVVTCLTNPPPGLEDGVACCNPKTDQCQAPDSNGVCSVGDITWCKSMDTNGDGTVTCHQ
jgi:hypothetical protein